MIDAHDCMLRHLLFYFALGQCAGAAVTAFGPVHYRGRVDSPFFGGMAAGDIIVEDVEDGYVNSPGLGIVSPHGVRARGGVDEEDGRLDDVARFGNLIEGPSSIEAPIQFDIRFAPSPDGRHPLYAGLALIGYVQAQPGVESYSLFSAWDGNGNLVSTPPFRIEDIQVSSFPGLNSTIGDQFFGIYSDTGISRIVIQRKRAIDHIQYGWAIPEPGTAVLVLAAGGLGLLVRRRLGRGGRCSTGGRSWRIS
ncbi:MAG: PEP-CTERM sorting domain-containing protein [Verrucomicrobiota bacterium]|jgi:hypothetical protein